MTHPCQDTNQDLVPLEGNCQMQRKEEFYVVVDINIMFLTLRFSVT